LIPGVVFLLAPPAMYFMYARRQIMCFHSYELFVW